MTAQEFVTAVNAGGTIEVDSDIDFNDYIFSSVVTIPSDTIINGNGYTVTNIQQGTINRIFDFAGACTINNLNIRNLNLPSIQLFSGASGAHILNECQISGICYILYSSGSYSYQSNITYNRCSMHISRFYNIRGTLNDCYMVVENNSVTIGSAYPLLGDYANNTYFKGNIKITGGMTVSTNFVNCCINIDIEDNGFTINFNFANMPISVINSDKASNISLTSNIIAVTDAEMHDAQSLFDKGFDIYVP